MSTDHSPVPGRSWRQEPTSGACCQQHAVYHVASAAGRDLIYASHCTGIFHFNLIKKHLSQNGHIMC